MTNIAMYNFLDIIKIMLPIIPSVAISFSALSNNSKLYKCYEIFCILLGFTFFPSNEYVGMTVGAFVCCVIYMNYERVHKGRPPGGLIFPCLFFFNLSSFSGVSKFENICMLMYASVGSIYIAGLAIKKDNKDFLMKHEKFCILVSALIFISIKIIFLLFTDNLIIQ